MDNLAPKEIADEEMINQAFHELLNDYLNTKHRKKVEIITKAFNFANQAHKGIKRRSGEPYIMHPIAVASIVCNEIGLGSTSICAALLHDVVEIDAGDTYAYDEKGKETQKAREEAAKERIYGLLPEDQKECFQQLFEEFEARETAESKFAHAMDNLQPLLLNDSNNGGDWKAHRVTAEQVYGRQSQTKDGSEVLFEWTDAVIQKNIAAGNIQKES